MCPFRERCRQQRRDREVVLENLGLAVVQFKSIFPSCRLALGGVSRASIPQEVGNKFGIGSEGRAREDQKRRMRREAIAEQCEHSHEMRIEMSA